MKVVAYSIKVFEKEYLAKTNKKKHDITLISNALTEETCVYAEGKKAVIVSREDEVSVKIIQRLADMGIRYIATRSIAFGPINRDMATKHEIKIAKTYFAKDLQISRPSTYAEVLIKPHQKILTIRILTEIAMQTIESLDVWERNELLIAATQISLLKG